MYRYIFFDLDGTLTDSSEGITKSMQYALSCMGIEEPDLKKLECFIGPPLIPAVMEKYEVTEEWARELLDHYRVYFTDRGIYENRLYDGVEQMLERLKSDGRILAVASSKPEAFVRRILEYFHIDGYFDYVCGATMDEKRTKKEEVLQELLERMEFTGEAGKEILMVGDRKHDVEGAAHFGIPCLGLSLGFASEGELEQAGAIAVVDDMEELAEYILNVQTQAGGC